MRFRSPLRVFKDKGGNVALIAALCLIPLAFAGGFAIDFNNAARVRQALQDATDSAALAIARNASSITDSGLNAAAKNYVSASYSKGVPFTIATATIDRTNLTVTVRATSQVPTSFAALIGKNTLPVAATSIVKGQGFDYEIVLVVDNSGSMASSLGAGSTKIAELRTASTALLDAMMTTANAGKVKIGIVPFASSVKVGSAYSTATWLDTGALNTISDENFNSNKKRLELYNRNTGGVRNVTWAGCVESRTIKVGTVTRDYDIDDTTPTTSNSDTLFVPWFAPDEPDDKDSWSSDSYSNNYLEDDEGSCTNSQNSAANTNAKKQALVCKYSNEDADTSGGRGPNYMCDSSAITPLTATRSVLDAAVSNLDADGNTNVGEGLAWGWRVISPTAPFTEARAYTTQNLQKVIVLMTDGQNNIPGRDTMNKSVYSSYGYMSKGRLGTTSNDSDTIRDKMDERLALACTKIKAAGILIYTVALGSDADATLLATCSSGTGYNFAPTTGAQLTPVFQSIAASINKLRISE